MGLAGFTFCCLPVLLFCQYLLTCGVILNCKISEGGGLADFRGRGA